MTTTAISLPAVKLLFLVFGFPYLSVLKPLDAREAGFLVHKHPFPALDLSLATSLWCCCLPRRVWKMRDCFKIFGSIHSTAGKLGRGTEKKRQSWHFALKADKRNLPKTYSCRDQSFSQSRDKTTVVSKEVGFFYTLELVSSKPFYKAPVFPCHTLYTKVPLGILPQTTQGFGAHPGGLAWDHPASL